MKNFIFAAVLLFLFANLSYADDRYILNEPCPVDHIQLPNLNTSITEDDLSPKEVNLKASYLLDLTDVYLKRVATNKTLEENLGHVKLMQSFTFDILDENENEFGITKQDKSIPPLSVLQKYEHEVIIDEPASSSYFSSEKLKKIKKKGGANQYHRGTTGAQDIVVGTHISPNGDLKIIYYYLPNGNEDYLSNEIEDTFKKLEKIGVKKVGNETLILLLAIKTFGIDDKAANSDFYIRADILLNKFAKKSKTNFEKLKKLVTLKGNFLMKRGYYQTGISKKFEITSKAGVIYGFKNEAWKYETGTTIETKNEKYTAKVYMSNSFFEDHFRAAISQSIDNDSIKLSALIGAKIGDDGEVILTNIQNSKGGEHSYTKFELTKALFGGKAGLSFLQREDNHHEQYLTYSTDLPDDWKMNSKFGKKNNNRVNEVRFDNADTLKSLKEELKHSVILKTNEKGKAEGHYSIELLGW